MVSRLQREMRVEPDPDDLLREAKAGSPDWGAILGVVHEPMSHAAVRGLLSMGLEPDLDRVADAVALGFERLMKKGLDECYTLPGYAGSFGFYAGKQIARDHYNKRESLIENPEGLFDEEASVPGEVLAALEEEQERQDLLAKRRQAFDECIDQLTIGQCEAVVEVELNLRTDTDVAADKDVSHTAIRSRRKKGIEHLKRCIEKKLDLGSGKDV